MFRKISALVSCLSLAITSVVAANVTLAAADANFVGTWDCTSNTTASASDACALGCRAHSAGDSLDMWFQATDVYLTLYRSDQSSFVLDIKLDGTSTTYNPRSDQDDLSPGCYDNVAVASALDPTILHQLTVTVLSVDVGDEFNFGGVTVVLDPSGQSTSGQTATPAQPKKENVALIAGVIGGIVAFWVLVGLTVWYARRVQRSANAPMKLPIMTLDNEKGQIQSIGFGGHFRSDSDASMSRLPLHPTARGVSYVQFTPSDTLRSHWSVDMAGVQVPTYPAKVQSPLALGDAYASSSLDSVQSGLGRSRSQSRRFTNIVDSLAIEGERLARLERELQGAQGSPVSPPYSASRKSRYANGQSRHWV